MKKIISLLAFVLPILIFAQVPQGISYQAIALNSSGNPIVNSNVGIRLSVLDNSASGTVLYSETHSKTTNTQGLFNLVIGQGTPATGTFITINWATNTKFLKVEMDTAGGANYVLVGTTQLLSVPYALAADSLVTSPGEGITLVSPNGTPYQVTVNDAGQLSLPTSGTTGSGPSVYYMNGNFNNFEVPTALLLSANNSFGVAYSKGYKYLTSGTQIKFLSGNTIGAQIYGINNNFEMVANGIEYTIPSNGFYHINILKEEPGFPAIFSATSIVPNLIKNQGFNTQYYNPTYNSSTNTFTFTVTGVINTDYFTFGIPNYINATFGDNLNDGSIDIDGIGITAPGSTSTPKNYRVDLIINFNGSGTYTITQI